MPCGQVTIGAAATQVQTNTQRAMQLWFQNNSAHSIRVGDSASVSMTVPAAVNGGTAGFGTLVLAGGSVNVGTFTSGATDLNQWYIAGTNTDVIDYRYNLEE
jgi:hypothetical protein